MGSQDRVGEIAFGDLVAEVATGFRGEFCGNNIQNDLTRLAVNGLGLRVQYDAQKAVEELVVARQSISF